MNKSEVTRIKHFLEHSREVDLTKVREVAQVYMELKGVMELAKESMGVLEPTLHDLKVSEFFPNKKMKVILQEGKERTGLNTKKVSDQVPLSDFIHIVSVSEKAVRDRFPEEADVIIAKAKESYGPGKATIKVGKMTKDELVEAAKQ